MYPRWIGSLSTEYVRSHRLVPHGPPVCLPVTDMCDQGPTQSEIVEQDWLSAENNTLAARVHGLEQLRGMEYAEYVVGFVVGSAVALESGSAGHHSVVPIQFYRRKGRPPYWLTVTRTE